ncbi:MAG TPA: hypothetical protein VNI02_18425 [Blastocatellia bacterium]|nr:hypothetical protein [Blastocatellia bacterium]
MHGVRERLREIAAIISVAGMSNWRPQVVLTNMLPRAGKENQFPARPVARARPTIQAAGGRKSVY